MRCALLVAADSSLRPKLPYSSLSVLDRYQVVGQITIVWGTGRVQVWALVN